MTTDALPTAQIDGVVYAQLVAGGTVFAGGSFTSARPAGGGLGTTDQVTRSNLLSYDLATGELTSFAPVVNGQVKTLALSPDGKTLYVGGAFTRVGGQVRNRFAAFAIADGSLTSFAPNFNSSVSALVVSRTTVYAGGSFSNVGGRQRLRLVAISLKKKKLTAWAPAADSSVLAMILTPDQKELVVGGSFAELNAKKALGMGMISVKSGKTKTWKVNKVVKDYGEKGAVVSLSADGDTVYGTTISGGGSFEGVFAARPKDGVVRWLQDCHGDTYSVVPVGDVVYSVGHAHSCSNIGGFPETQPRTNYRALAVTKTARGTVATNSETKGHYGNFSGQPAPSLLNWFPLLSAGSYTGKGQAAWSAAAAGGYLLLGGEFLSVNGREQQGLVRFALPGMAPRAQGPVLEKGSTTPTASVAGPDSVAVSWPGNYDRDDLSLTYELLRDGEVISARTSEVPFWKVVPLDYVDRGLQPGRTYSYRVRVVDPDGNDVLSPQVTVDLPEATSRSTPPTTRASSSPTAS